LSIDIVNVLPGRPWSPMLRGRVRQRRTRQHKGSRSESRRSLVVKENQSHRDLTKVAEYEVLGYRFSREPSVPDGTIDGCWQSLSRVQDRKPIVSIVPRGTDVSFCFVPSTSYWATFIESLWDKSSPCNPNPVLAQMGGCRTPGNYPTRSPQSSQRIADVANRGFPEPHVSDEAFPVGKSLSD